VEGPDLGRSQVRELRLTEVHNWSRVSNIGNASKGDFTLPLPGSKHLLSFCAGLLPPILPW
jgi:hypothetical protein